MTETAKAETMQARCDFSRPVLIKIKPAVSRIVAVPLRQAFNVGSDSVKVIAKYCDSYKYRYPDVSLVLLEIFFISLNCKYVPILYFA